MKAGPIVGLAIIVAAIAYGAFAFKSSLVAYVPFQDAIATSDTGRTIQIIGSLVQGQTHYDSTRGSLEFVMKEADSNNVMPVFFKSPKPDNFDSAAKVTAIGHYDPSVRMFEADNLLVKCPSKYADARGTTHRYGAKT